jgi:hypothetical protein
MSTHTVQEQKLSVISEKPTLPNNSLLNQSVFVATHVHRHLAVEDDLEEMRRQDRRSALVQAGTQC